MLLGRTDSRAVRADERVESGFLNRCPARVHQLDRAMTDIDPNDLVPPTGNARRHAGSQFAQANDREGATHNVFRSHNLPDSPRMVTRFSFLIIRKAKLM